MSAQPFPSPAFYMPPHRRIGARKP
jgi:hypothetical protein